jgi:hypothetical protein
MLYLFNKSCINQIPVTNWHYCCLQYGWPFVCTSWALLWYGRLTLCTSDRLWNKQDLWACSVLYLAFSSIKTYNIRPGWIWVNLWKELPNQSWTSLRFPSLWHMAALLCLFYSVTLHIALIAQCYGTIFKAYLKFSLCVTWMDKPSCTRGGHCSAIGTLGMCRQFV